MAHEGEIATAVERLRERGRAVSSGEAFVSDEQMRLWRSGFDLDGGELEAVSQSVWSEAAQAVIDSDKFNPELPDTALVAALGPSMWEAGVLIGLAIAEARQRRDADQVT